MYLRVLLAVCRKSLRSVSVALRDCTVLVCDDGMVLVEVRVHEDSVQYIKQVNKSTSD